MKRYLSIAFIVAIISTLFSGLVFAEEKIIQASEIGKTVDQVFPWYVAQAQITGYTSLATFAFMTTVGISLIVFGMHYSNKHKQWREMYENEWFTRGNKNQEVIGLWLFAVGLIISILCALYIIFGDFTSSVTKIMNPQYSAMESLTSSMSKLIEAAKSK